MREKPVFVAEDGRRQATLRFGALVVAALMGAWLIALIAGALGFGRLPVLPLPSVGALHDRGGAQAQAGPRKSDQAEPAADADSAAASSTPTSRKEHSAPVGQKTPSRGSGGTGKAAPGQSRPSPVHGPGVTVPVASPSPTTTSTTSSTTPSRAPSQTPSGNPVPSGTTGPGSASGRALYAPGFSTRPSSGR
jgi:hypothetical protein